MYMCIYVVDELYMYMCICVVDEFLTCYWRWFGDVSMYSKYVGELHMYMCIYVVEHICCWWVSYMLLATIWWCKHVFKYVGELYMYMCIYVVDEFLTCYWRRFDGVSMYWNMLVLIWWRMCEYMHFCWWVICSCIHDWWWQILYPYWRRLWCVCCIMRWWPQSWLGTTCI